MLDTKLVYVALLNGILEQSNVPAGIIVSHIELCARE